MKKMKMEIPSSVAAMSIVCFLFTATFHFSLSASESVNASIFIPGSSLVFPIQGDISRNGFYSTMLYFGNPPKPFILDIDTGSDLTWVQCAASSHARLLKAPNKPYIPNKNVVFCKDPLCPFVHQYSSNVCKSPSDQCDYEVQYADYGSSLGVIVKDVVPLRFSNGSSQKPLLAFGCGYDQEFAGPFSPPYVDGVLGLGHGKASIVSQLSKMGMIKNVIAHCLPSQGNGYLFLGDGLVPKGLVWTKISPNSMNHYVVGPMDLLKGKTVGASGLQIVFDSGSTYTYFSPKAYQSTLSLITKDLVGKQLSSVKDSSLPVCWKGVKPFKSVNEVKSHFSPLVLSLVSNRTIAFVLPPEGYILVNSIGNVCLGILNSIDSKLGNVNIIGDISLQDKLVVYDNERQMIGWTPTNCNKPHKP
ncbi:aspartic proteinase Asp1-like [Impatiens glandulifera]|uniref:aspartic proteinase Asp1-like n=1 Tax=Impatiens glandulifera TaxID=253017 RepID=UPI001FB07F03|nr:aspartic proteinase Asp1-like [Impatiens glandulifera]